VSDPAQVRVAWVLSALMSVPATSSPDSSGPPVPTPVDADAFRRAVGHFGSGVTVVTARVDGVDHAMTASAFTSVSLEPVLVLVCVDKEARFRDAVLESGLWGVSVLSAAGRQAADWFATKGRPLVGQLDRFPHHRGRSTDVALLDGAVAWLEVRSTAVYDGGDHDIVVGEVIDLAIGDRDASALVYHRGHYGHLP
jgi:flavin reductase (DIM6/NTAB) family NADH-FMN oxidoreductase RutF